MNGLKNMWVHIGVLTCMTCFTFRAAAQPVIGYSVLLESSLSTVNEEINRGFRGAGSLLLKPHFEPTSEGMGRQLGDCDFVIMPEVSVAGKGDWQQTELNIKIYSVPALIQNKAATKSISPPYFDVTFVYGKFRVNDWISEICKEIRYFQSNYKESQDPIKAFKETSLHVQVSCLNTADLGYNDEDELNKDLALMLQSNWRFSKIYVSYLEQSPSTSRTCLKNIFQASQNPNKPLIVSLNKPGRASIVVLTDKCDANKIRQNQFKTTYVLKVLDKMN